MVPALTVSVLALAALLSPAVQAQGSPSIPAPASVLAARDLRAGELQRLRIEAQENGWKWSVNLAGEECTVHLVPHDLRAKGFRLLVEDARGIQEAEPGACTTYRGGAFPGGHLVAASFDGARLLAWIDLGGEVWAAESLSVAEQNRTGYELLLHRGVDAIPRGVCGVQAGTSPGVPSLDGSGQNRYEAEIAVDCDLEFWQRNGRSTQAVQDSVVAHVNAVDAIYFRDADIVYTITTILVRTTRVYTWNDDMGDLLGQFRSRWRAMHGGIRRDVAHLFTGKGSYGGVIGVAWLGQICSTNRGYGTSKVFGASFPSRVELIAHELGHNWDCNHCSGGSCRIMCASLGGCSGVTNRFASVSIAQIESHRNSRSCLRILSNSAPVLNSVSPLRAQAWGGEILTLEGDELRGVSDVNIGSVAVPSSSLVVLSNQRVQVAVPRGVVPPRQPVTAVNSVGPSNAIDLLVEPTDPPRLSATGLLSGPGQTFNYDWGGKPGALYAVALTVNDPFTIPFQGDDVLARGYPILSGVLDASGIGGISALVDPPPGIRVYSQLWTLELATGDWCGASEVRGTVFW